MWLGLVLANMTSCSGDPAPNENGDTTTSTTTTAKPEENGGEDEDDECCYDKTKSFFDKISCEATDRAKGWVYCLNLPITNNPHYSSCSSYHTLQSLPTVVIPIHP